MSDPIAKTARTADIASCDEAAISIIENYAINDDTSRRRSGKHEDVETFTTQGAGGLNLFLHEHTERIRAIARQKVSVRDSRRDGKALMPCGWPVPFQAGAAPRPYRGPRAVPHVALHGLPQLRGIRRVAHRHPPPATMC